MADKVKVLSVLRFTEEQLARLREVSSRLEIWQVPCRTSEEMLLHLGEPEVLYALAAYFSPDKAPHLRWVQLASAGIDHLLDKPIMKSDITVTTTSGIAATPIAEYVFASMLAFARKFPELIELQRKHEWPRQRWYGRKATELRGATIGIVGYGSIGREVGRLAKAFGMRVLAAKRSVQVRVDSGYAEPGVGDRELQYADRVYPPDDLTQMVALCDYVVVATPLTPETRGLVSEGVLRAMRPNAYLVNIARGEVVDEPALLRALREGWIAGAGLDVFAGEPLPPESPFYETPNVIVTPHISSSTNVYTERAAEVFAENLRRYLDGRPLLNVVDKARGY